MEALQLPAPFDTVTPAAYLRHGHRYMLWQICEPGQLHRNRFEMARVEVTEREAWKGEPLWLSADRIVSPTGRWEPFTRAGRDALSAAIVPKMGARFDQLWLAMHRSQTDATASDSAAAAARRMVRWWEERAELDQMHARGDVELVPVDRQAGNRSTVPQLDVYSHRPQHVAVAAAAFVAGERVGWLTCDGALIPDASVLGRV